MAKVAPTSTVAASPKAPTAQSLRRFITSQLVLLTIIGALDFFDDNLIYVASGLLGQELHLSDFLISLIPFVESFSYAITALFIAVLADRYSRKPIIAVGILIWAIMTALGGITIDFWTFAATRLAIGSSQPTFDGPAASAASDYYPKEKRAWALGVLGAGDFIGIIVGSIAESWLIGMYGWRPVFIGVACLAFLVFVVTSVLLREPVRGFSDGNTTATPTPPLGVAWREGLYELKSEFGSIFGNWWKIIATLARCLQYSGFVGAGFFFPVLLLTEYGLGVDDAGYLFGGVVVASVLGSIVGGWIAGRLYRFGPGRHFVLSGIYLILMAISYMSGLFIGTLNAVVIGGLLLGLFIGAANPSLVALLGEMHPTGRRAYAFAAQTAPTFLISSFAPLIIGTIATALGSLRMGSAIFMVVVAVGGIGVLFSSRLVRSQSPEAVVVPATEV